MKKPSNGLGVGLWVVGGIVGLYLIGAIFISLDLRFFRGEWFAYLINSSPPWFYPFLVDVYAPTLSVLKSIGLIP